MHMLLHSIHFQISNSYSKRMSVWIVYLCRKYSNEISKKTDLFCLQIQITKIKSPIRPHYLKITISSLFNCVAKFFLNSSIRCQLLKISCKNLSRIHTFFYDSLNFVTRLNMKNNGMEWATKKLLWHDLTNLSFVDATKLEYFITKIPNMHKMH